MNSTNTLRRAARLAFAIGLALFAGVPGAAAQCPATIQREADAWRWTEASTAAQAGATRNGADASAHACAGRIALLASQPDRAVAAYERAIALEPALAEHHLRLGQALGFQLAQGGMRRAFSSPRAIGRIRRAFERAVELAPAHVDARQGLMQFYAMVPRLMGGSMDRAREQAVAIMRLNRMQGHIALATLAETEDDFAGAERAYRAAVAAAPRDSIAAALAYGTFLQSRESWPAAFAVYDSLIVARPDDAAARLGYARTAARSGQNLARGERELRAWLAARPAETTAVTAGIAHRSLGAILDRLGRDAEAITAYETALRLNPRDGVARAALDSLREGSANGR